MKLIMSLSKLASLNTLNVRHTKLKKAISQAKREVIMTGEPLNVNEGWYT